MLAFVIIASIFGGLAFDFLFLSFLCWLLGGADKNAFKDGSWKFWKM